MTSRTEKSRWRSCRGRGRPVPNPLPQSRAEGWNAGEGLISGDGGCKRLAHPLRQVVDPRQIVVLLRAAFEVKIREWFH